MKCPNCGTENQADYRFCSSCGEDLAKLAVGEVNASPGSATETVVTPQAAVAPAQPAAVVTAPPLETHPPAVQTVSVPTVSPEPRAPVVYPSSGTMSFGQVKASSLGVRIGSRMAVVPANRLAGMAAELEKCIPVQNLPDVRAGRVELVESGEADILQGYMLQNFTGVSIFVFLRPFGTQALIGWHIFRKFNPNRMYLGVIAAVMLVMGMISGFSGGYFSLFNVFTGFLIWGAALLAGSVVVGKIRYDNPWLLFIDSPSRADSDALQGMELVIEGLLRQASGAAGVDDLRFKSF